MLEKIHSQASQVAEAAEVFRSLAEETAVTFEANRLKQVQGRQVDNVALRIIHQGRLGFATASGKVAGKALVQQAMEAAGFGAQAHFQFPAYSSFPGVNVHDPATERVSVEEMVGLGQSLIDRVRQHTPELVCEARVVRVVVEHHILSSAAQLMSYRSSFFRLELEGTLIRGTDMLFVGDDEVSCQPIRDIGPVAEATIGQLERARFLASVPTGYLPAVFTPKGVASAFLVPLMVAFNGRIVLQGASPLGQRLGQKAFPRDISLWDDATLAYRPASRPWDGEGVPSQRTTLIEQGVVANFIYDLQTAGMAGAKSTGNASRAMGAPAPMPNSLVIGQGKASLQDMLRDMKEGLLIEQLIGAEQGNVLGGDFGGNVLLGYRVEKGNIVGRVKDTMVSGNIYQLLQEAVVGREAHWAGGMLYTPHLYVPRLAVSSKG